MKCSSIPGSSGGVTAISDKGLAKRRYQAGRDESTGGARHECIAARQAQAAARWPWFAASRRSVRVLSRGYDRDMPALRKASRRQGFVADGVTAPDRQRRIAVGIEKLAVKS